MIGILELFETSARELDQLTAEAASAPAAITAEWISRARDAISRTQEAIQSPGVALETFNFCTEVKHYRTALLKLKEITEKGQASLTAENSKLHNEHMRIKRVQNWAESVEVLT
jgi:hypothetical protein